MGPHLPGLWWSDMIVTRATEVTKASLIYLTFGYIYIYSHIRDRGYKVWTSLKGANSTALSSRLKAMQRDSSRGLEIG